MGGTVKVESVLGEGSTFSIIFKVMCKVATAKVMKKEPVLQENNHEFI